MQEKETGLRDEIALRRSRREERRRRRRLKKAVISAVTAVCILFGTAAYTGLHNRTVAEAGSKTDVREDTGGSLSGKTVILHSGDVHGAIDGYAKMAALKKDFEADGAEVVVADAGDFSSSDIGEDSFGAIDGFMMMRLAGYDVATFGDAEFAQGYDKLRNDISGAKIRLICANVLKDDKSLLNPDYTYNTSGGKKIGFLGLTGKSECDGLTFLSGEDLYECAGAEAESLKKSGADVVIALTHLGTEDKDGNSIDLYNKTDGIDFIIDGNSYEPMTEGAGGEPIQSVGEGFDYIGVVVLDRNARIEDHYIMSTEKLRADEGVQADADRLKAHIDMTEVSAGQDDPVSENEAETTNTETGEVDPETENAKTDASKTEKKADDESDTKSITSDTIDKKPQDNKSDETTAEESKKETDKGEAGKAEADKEEAGKAEADKAEADKAEDKAEDQAAEEKPQEEKEDNIASLQDGKYEVVKGDCLWNIAKKYLGDGARWGEIYELNKGEISNPSLIYVGQQLVMPPG